MTARASRSQAARRGGINPAAWLLWFVAAAAIPTTTRHPYYLALVLIAVMIVHLTVEPDEGAGRPWRLFAYVGSTAAVLSIGFNVLTVHTGDRPFGRLPDGLPIIGGPLTWNAVVYGVCSAMAISALLFAAATFNGAVRHSELIRALPSRFQRLGVAGAIAMTFVPQTLQAGRDIYDAQRARGRSMRTLSDVHAFLTPLLGSGLERAFALSEALETRGYGSRAIAAEPGRGRKRLAYLAALAMVVAALPLVATGRLLPAMVLAAGAGLLGAASGGRTAGSRRRLRWNRASKGVAVASALAITIAVWGHAAGDTLNYWPFPRLDWPEFQPLVGLAPLLLLGPAAVEEPGRR